MVIIEGLLGYHIIWTLPGFDKNDNDWDPDDYRIDRLCCMRTKILLLISIIFIIFTFLYFTMVKFFNGDIIYYDCSSSVFLCTKTEEKYHKYDFPYLMAELFHMYDVWNEPVLNQNVSWSIQNWSIIWPSSSSYWWH